MRTIRSWLPALFWFVIAGLLPVYAQTGGWVNVRNINTSMNVQNATDGTLVNAAWKQAESVNWYHRSTLGGQSFPLTASNLLIKLEIFDTAQSILYLTSTGSIYNASTGQMLFSLTPDDSNLIEDEYRGYISLYQTNGATVVNMGVLAVARVTVEYSANSGNYTFIGNDIENVRSNAVYELKLGEPILTGAVERTQSSTGASYTIRFPVMTGIGTDLTARASTSSLETNVAAAQASISSLVTNVAAAQVSIADRPTYSEIATSNANMKASIGAGVSNNVRGGYFGSYTQDVVIGKGATRGTGQESRGLVFRGFEAVDGDEDLTFNYYPLGDNDLLYFTGQDGTEKLLMSNGNIRAERMTNDLDDVYQRVGVGASATNAVSSLSYTGPVIGAVTLVGGGITQTDRVFNLDGFAEDTDLASYYPANNPSNFALMQLSADLNVNTNDLTNVANLSSPSGNEIRLEEWAVDGNTNVMTGLNADKVDGRSVTDLITRVEWNGFGSVTDYASRVTFNSWTTQQGVVNASAITDSSGGTNTGAIKSYHVGYTSLGSTSALASYAFGLSAGETSTGTYTHSYGREAGKSGAGNSAHNYGERAGAGEKGERSHNYGFGAGTLGSGSYAHAYGVLSGYAAGGLYPHFLGYSAGWASTGDYLHAVGTYAGAYAKTNNTLIVDMLPATPTLQGGWTNSFLILEAADWGVVQAGALGRSDGQYRLRGQWNVEGKLDGSNITNFPSTLRTVAAETSYNTNNSKVFVWSSLTASQSLTYASLNIVGGTNLVIGMSAPSGTNKLWFQGVLNVQP